ncbi:MULTISPECIES: FAD-dependent oxidoreductase [Mumia]|uniref:FAD-dependent oxidoreductase n=1 Tax=Mumia TaxID=1546255 RepID=UPI001FB96675|nr:MULTISPECIES: FAD-dependent oxidoreductase [unclassified Mumia]
MSSISTESRFDVVVVGAGTAGIPCAIHAAQGGARVLLVDKDARVGGTLHVTGGHMAAGGTRRQAEKGVEDSAEAHLADIRRITRGTARDDLISIVAMNAADTIEWLQDRDFPFAPETPRLVYGHEPYTVARTYYGKDEGLSVFEVLKEELDRTVAEHDLTVWTKTPVVELRQDETGAVVGVSVLRGSDEIAVDADAVVLATGGYAAEPELFEELEGAPLVSAAAKTSTGDGLQLGLAAGAGLQGAGTHLPTFGGLPDPQNPTRANWNDRQRLTSERPPREIYVDLHGKRWVREDEESIDEKERALATIADQTFWTIFDDAALALSTGDLNEMIVGKDPDQVRAVVDTRPGLHSADTLAELADKAGIDVEGLATTVSDYNAYVAAQDDPEFGRTYLPAPIEKGPFYALRNHAITLVTFQGLDIDDSFAVRSNGGDPIPGLYAVGEVIGAGATCGNTFCSGMLMTPALTFGRLLGSRLAER